MAAGLPLYIALFGRDTLTTAWQSAMVDTGMLRGTLVRIGELQGRRFDDWRDEQPGRMLHEAHTGPLEVLGYNPRSRYYGSITTSAMFPLSLCQLWHWSGDKHAVRPFIEPAMKALNWLDEHGDLDDDGFYEYKTRSSQGTTHQAWKDDGRAVRVDAATRSVQRPFPRRRSPVSGVLSPVQFSAGVVLLGDFQSNPGDVRHLSVRPAEDDAGRPESSRVAPPADARRSACGRCGGHHPVFPPGRRYVALPGRKKSKELCTSSISPAPGR